ncbi:hypothetical protein LTV02_37175 [Nocardia yamanashiensis]|uniref:hypothetical protein n=1 Tax=Nocardia yamanashiensis TaxID=209247 RepID=UPI001E537A29|nr:hypothetical protein [Nocardia yamanashiensis]UGT41501.1 hypothetical protein LTV02_37175 [Nocardia yamanashiensis]
MGVFSPRCPVGELERLWIEEMMSWCAAQFGDRTLRTPVILPTGDFFPGDYSGTESQVRSLVERVAGYMGVERDRIVVEVHPDGVSLPEALGYPEGSTRGEAGHYRLEHGRAVVSLEMSQLRAPVTLVATVAHELAHERLLGEGRIEPDRHDGEQLTDLLTVFLGLGVFNANAAFQFSQNQRGWQSQRLGYLPQPMFGYALACWSFMRGDSKPVWAGHLDTNPRVYMKQGLRYLRANPDALPGWRDRVR